MRNMLLKSLLKAKSSQHEEVEALIATYLRDVANKNKAQSDAFVSELLVFVMQKVEQEIDKTILLNMVSSKINSLGYTIETAVLETIYEKSAVAIASSVGAVFSFDKTDVEVLDSMYRALTWMKEDGASNTQDKLKLIIGEAMEGEVNMVDLGEKLREGFLGVVDESARYFEGVSDHVIRQSQSVTRAYQFEKAGVQSVKVVAVMDNRTSTICMSLDGRIIETGHVIQQADAITAAQNIEEKKKASRWQTQPIFGALKKDVALPPYHFRCRTIVVAYFPQSVEIDGKNVNGSLLPGEIYRGKKVLFSHVDQFGYERVLTVDSLDHDEVDKHYLSRKEVRSGLATIDRMSAHSRFQNRSLGYSKQNEMLFVFRGGEIHTVFRPEQKVKEYNSDRKLSTEVTKGATLQRFNIRLGHSSHIKKEDLKHTVLGRLQDEGYTPLPDEEAYKNIAISGVNKEGKLDYIFIGQHYEAELVLDAVKDDPLFQREAHFTVQGKLEEKSLEFDGTLFDALLVIVNEGAKYDV